MTFRARFLAVAWLLAIDGTWAAESPAPAGKPLPVLHEAGPAQVAPADLNHSIERVLERREYAWRLPRKADAEPEKGWVASFFSKVRQWFVDVGQKINEWFKSDHEQPQKMRGGFSPPFARSALWVLLGIAIVGGLWLVIRARRRPAEEVISATAVETVPDLHSESVTADQLPEDRWLQLARELLERGELRLALRAFYLACLALLGRRELLSIARHKSNLDYRRELKRRASQRRELLGAFEENVVSFERVWYGRAEVTSEVVDRFNTNLEVIRAGAGGRP
jgi:hypothetical protein